MSHINGTHMQNCRNDDKSSKVPITFVLKFHINHIGSTSDELYQLTRDIYYCE